MGKGDEQREGGLTRFFDLAGQLRGFGGSRKKTRVRGKKYEIKHKKNTFRKREKKREDSSRSKSIKRRHRASRRRRDS